MSESKIKLIAQSISLIEPNLQSVFQQINKLPASGTETDYKSIVQLMKSFGSAVALFESLMRDESTSGNSSTLIESAREVANLGLRMTNQAITTPGLSDVDAVHLIMRTLRNLEYILNNYDEGDEIFRVMSTIAVAESAIENQKKSMREIAARFGSLIALQKKLEDKTNLTVSRSESLLEKCKSDVEAKTAQINSILQIVSGNALHGTYARQAQLERYFAEGLRLVAVCVMGAVAYNVFLIFSHLQLLQTNSPSASQALDIYVVLLRLLFSIFLSIPAAYLAKESARHRIKSYEFMQKGLELASLEPYINSMDKGDQNLIKSRLADKIFSFSAFESKSTDNFPIDLQDLLKELLKNLKENGKS